MSEPSRCRAAGITHGVRFKKGGGGGREREARLGPLSAVVHFSLFDIFFPSSLSSSANALRPGSPSSLLLLALTPELRAKSPQGARQPPLRCRTSTGGSPSPCAPPSRAKPSPWASLCSHLCKLPISTSSWPNFPDGPAWHLPTAVLPEPVRKPQPTVGAAARKLGENRGKEGKKKILASLRGPAGLPVLC